MTEYYLVEREELVELIASQLKLIALEQDGVDNWCGYGESFKDVKRSNIPDALYSDPEISDMEKEDFRDTNITFYKVATAIVKYDYKRKVTMNE